MKKFFTLIAAAIIAVSAGAQSNHFLKITSKKGPGNNWDSQLFINLKNIPNGEPCKVVMSVKSTASFEAGTESIDDMQTEHTSVWNASSVFNYTDVFTPTSDWSDAEIYFPGKTKVECHKHCTVKEGFETIDHNNGNTSTCDAEIIEDFEYAATAILLNIGKLPNGEVLYIDDINVYDLEGNLLYTEDFENEPTIKADNKSATVYYPGWQGAADIELDEVSDHVIEDYMFKVDVDEVKKDMWDSQVMVEIPTLEVGKHYGIVASFRSSEPEVEIQCVIEDNASENKDQYGNSADLAYSDNFKVTDTWAQCEAIWSYKDENENWHPGTDGKYPYNRIIFQLGKMSGTLYIDNIKIIEISEEGGKQVVDFKDGITPIAYKRGWHGHVSVSKAESDVPEFDDPVYEVPTAISNVAVESAKTAKALKNGQIVITRGAKAYNAVGQEL